MALCPITKWFVRFLFILLLSLFISPSVWFASFLAEGSMSDYVFVTQISDGSKALVWVTTGLGHLFMFLLVRVINVGCRNKTTSKSQGFNTINVYFLLTLQLKIGLAALLQGGTWGFIFLPSLGCAVLYNPHGCAAHPNWAEREARREHAEGVLRVYGLDLNVVYNPSCSSGHCKGLEDVSHVLKKGKSSCSATGRSLP